MTSRRRQPRTADQPRVGNPAAEQSDLRRGRLYIVAGPIGNLTDITIRALDVLRTADLIVAEDTRVTRKLLSRYEIRTRVESCHQHSRAEDIERFLDVLSAGRSIAHITDAGTPCVSDPGDRLIRAALEAGHTVTPIPGASAVTTAVSIAAVPGGRFAFDGFPPRGRSDRTEFFRGLRSEHRAVVLFETARRLIRTLTELHDSLGSRQVLIGRELTKVHEDIFRGNLAEACSHYTESPPIGEVTIVLYPNTEKTVESSAWEIEYAIRTALEAGQRPSDALKRTMDLTGCSRNAAYRALLVVQGKREG